jgi:ribosomal protein S18 acetylase RimI-like enzyme
MESLRCLCGAQLQQEDDAGLFVALREHVEQAHAHWKLPEWALREVLARRAQMVPWDGAPLPVPGDVEIRPLGPDRLGDLLRFFDREGFRANPFWASCYCMEAHFTGSPEEWTRRTAELNRTEKSELIRNGQAHGYLAYAGGQPIGWCHAAPRLSLAGLMQEREFHVDDPEGVGSIYCFVIAPPYRRQGVAGRLLDAACEGFRTQALTVAEAYPPREVKSDAGGYQDTLAMYLAAGFYPHRESERQIIVRKHLS